MTKKITIILKENHPKLGKKGNLSIVASGYAFNYLIPNNIAETASNNKIKHFRMFEEIKNKKDEQQQLEAKNLVEILSTIKKISITKKMGENKQFFGNVNEKDVIKTLYEQTGKIFTKKQIYLEDMKTINIYPVTIKVYDNIESRIKIHILPENI